ncbi:MULTISPECIES: DUF6507 family protein [Streptomyces]|uniref:DUF6507 family protein n=1 Tax=Streptomyces katrae TaxID=68223 RepID=A0ABT7GY48_9ACTN|nr:MULTISPECIES: DUF6507 family protein [Streptomyces]MDK9498164.1 DUF6507 family protein [Streptomyces katrae]RST00001.1 hypothetical protein EF910_33165 [Streptomyces sp. WAC07149]GLX20588.1 hypothetical protein Slala01_42320 [Streptomyces lavendulae subsp. lavendulae]GLX28250.1 hypothetical protein Slala02_40700 [Streptomyces lavendulae subsp. lavendulae]
MDWDIKPSGVQGVVNKTITAAEGFQKAGKSLQTELPEAAKHAGTITPGGGSAGEGGGMGPIAGALGGLMQSHDYRLAYIGKRTEASINGAINATTAYVQGNIEQAQNAQNEALKEPKIDLPGAGQK